MHAGWHLVTAGPVLTDPSDAGPDAYTSAEAVRDQRRTGADGLVVRRHVRAVRGARVRCRTDERTAGGVEVECPTGWTPLWRSTAGISPGAAWVEVSVPIFSKSWETRSSSHSWPSTDDLR